MKKAFLVLAALGLLFPGFALAGTCPGAPGLSEEAFLASLQKESPAPAHGGLPEGAVPTACATMCNFSDCDQEFSNCEIFCDNGRGGMNYGQWKCNACTCTLWCICNG